MRVSRDAASSVMVGRDTELRRLLRLAADPQPQVALLAGEAGIGKSRLISELIRSLPATTVVLAGQADPGSLGRPLEVLLDALGPADEDAALLADPSLAQIERLHAALTIVQRRVEGRAAVVVFDDLHFADPESITLFERLANLPERVLLLGSYRPDEVTSRSPLGAMIARLQHRHALTQLLLDRLDVAETSEFLTTATGSPPSYRSTVELHRRTGGNPFFLEELLRAGEGEDADALSEKPLPWSLAEALLRQLEDLDPVSRRTVETAAVLGHRVPFDLLAATTGTDEDTLIAQLRDLVGRGVLVETEPDEFSFRHALVREAIDHQLLARQRRRIHESALEILVATGGDDALVARHACGAGRYDDMVTAARRGSADYLAAGSPFQALQLAELGLQEAPDDDLLLDVATQSAWRARLFDDAIRHGSHWETVATTDTDRTEAKCLLFLVAWAGDDLDQIERLTADLTQLVESLPDCRALGHAMVALAEGCIFRNRPEESLEWAERAAALGASIGDVGIELSALLAKGLTLTSTADGTERAATLLHHVAERAEAAAEWIVAARAWRGFLYTLPPSSYAEQALFLEHMRRDAERAGYETLAVAAYQQGRARLAMHDGDLRTAIDAIAAGMRRSGELAGAARSADYYLPIAAGLHLEAGDVDEAQSILDAFRPLAGTVSIDLPGMEFHVACRRRELARAAKALDALLATIAFTGSQSGSFGYDMITAAAYSGLPRADLHRLADAFGDVVRPWRDLIEATAAEADGDAASALAAYTAALGDDALPPAPLGSAHVGAARCLIRLGRRDEARELLSAAEALLARWAGWRVAELDDCRRALGLPASSRDGDPLTPREREIAHLLAGGLTNAQIAERLYISPKTAAVHVGNILRKLAVSSRTEVAASMPTVRPAAAPSGRRPS